MTPPPTAQPRETPSAVLSRIDNQRRYVEDNITLKQRDRTPYHLKQFHLLPAPINGHEVRPLLRRVPSNESLRNLLGENVLNEIERYQPTRNYREPILRQQTTEDPVNDRRLGPGMTLPVPIGRGTRYLRHIEEIDRQESILRQYHQKKRDLARWVHSNFYDDEYLYADMRNCYEMPTPELIQAFDLNPNERYRRPEDPLPQADMLIDHDLEEEEKEDEDSRSQRYLE